MDKLDVKGFILKGGYINVEKIKWIFDENTDPRVIKKAFEICEDISDGFPVFVGHKGESGENYSIEVAEDKIVVSGGGAAGAFYGLATLKKLISENNGKISCCAIEDYPDMGYRGFYQDTTRGRIPTIDTLKKLIDTMADLKMNSLQLYVEHTFDFKEYEFCRNELGYISAEEIRELDEYCRERFIELIPSLSCFGHLYHLLENEQYKHLCELKDFKQTRHYWIERMHHHTINPLLEESFSLITSLIDQHADAFSSDYFNICCDETFDLGSDVNSGKDKCSLYIDFIKKIVSYLEAKGKTVMMWGDIILKYPEKISELSDGIVFLNWNYDTEPIEGDVAKMKDKKQIICPGTSSWFGLSERTTIEIPNIKTLTEYGYKYGARGILNTNWGDLGNIASIDMAMYGMFFGARLGWNKNFELTADEKEKFSKYYYGNAEAISIIERFGEIIYPTNWRALLEYPDKYKEDHNLSAKDFENAVKICADAVKQIEALVFVDEDMKNEFLITAKGYALIAKWYGAYLGINIDCPFDFKKWLGLYKEAWQKNSKQSELGEVIRVFERLEDVGLCNA